MRPIDRSPNLRDTLSLWCPIGRGARAISRDSMWEPESNTECWLGREAARASHDSACGPSPLLWLDTWPQYDTGAASERHGSDSLFDKHKFFDRYPACKLAMTGYIFKSIIQLNLLKNVPLGIAIHYVLRAICSPESNLFAFGIEAPMHFESHLVD
jgi:hypothetical protein